MIDQLRDFAKKVAWLQPFFILAAVATLLLFGYLVLLVDSAAAEVYVIPCIVALLWSLLCLLLLIFFPGVPKSPGEQLKFWTRIKIRFIRTVYRIGLLLFILLSGVAIWLSLRMLGVWRAGF